MTGRTAVEVLWFGRHVCLLVHCLYLDLDDLDRGASLRHVLAPGAHGLEM